MKKCPKGHVRLIKVKEGWYCPDCKITYDENWKVVIDWTKE